MNSLDQLILSTGNGQLNKNLRYIVENNTNKLNVITFTEIADWSYRFFEEQGHGHFVSITSISGLFGYRVAPAYHAAKSYQIKYMEALRQKAYRARLTGKSIYYRYTTWICRHLYDQKEEDVLGCIYRKSI